jgi:hypothetical protein
MLPVARSIFTVNPSNLDKGTLMKISKKLAFGAAAIAILTAVVAQASTYCDSQCAQAGTNAYNQVMSQYPPLPGEQQCAGVAEPYKSQCIASIDAQRATGMAAAQAAYNQAYYSCKQTCT